MLRDIVTEFVAAAIVSSNMHSTNRYLRISDSLAQCSVGLFFQTIHSENLSNS